MKEAFEWQAFHGQLSLIKNDLQSLAKGYQFEYTYHKQYDILWEWYSATQFK